MPALKVLPHAQFCPEGAEFEVKQNANLCQSLLDRELKSNMHVTCPALVQHVT